MSSIGRRSEEQPQEEQKQNKPNKKSSSPGADGKALQKLINALQDNNKELKKNNEELKTSNKELKQGNEKILEAIQKQLELSENLIKKINEPTKIVVPMNNIDNVVAASESDLDSIFIPDPTKNLDSGKNSSISINDQNSKKNSALDEASAALKSLKKTKN